MIQSELHIEEKNVCALDHSVVAFFLMVNNVLFYFEIIKTDELKL